MSPCYRQEHPSPLMYYMALITASQQHVVVMSVGDILSRLLWHSCESITASYENSSLVNWQSPMLITGCNPIRVWTYASLPIFEIPISLLLEIINYPSLVCDSWWYAPNICFWNTVIEIQSNILPTMLCAPISNGSNSSHLLFLSLQHVNVVQLFCREHTQPWVQQGLKIWLRLLMVSVPAIAEAWILVLLWLKDAHTPRLGFKSNK